VSRSKPIGKAPWIKAIELDFNGTPTREIAEAVGVARSTVYLWQQDPEYQSELRRLTEEANRAVVAKARRLREQALSIGMASVQRGAQALAASPSDASVASVVSKMAHEWYKTTSGQVGPVERTESMIVHRVTSLDRVAAAIAGGVSPAMLIEALEEGEDEHDDGGGEEEGA
jgi:hypothetical protein